MQLMTDSEVDPFSLRLSHIPDDISALKNLLPQLDTIGTRNPVINDGNLAEISTKMRRQTKMSIDCYRLPTKYRYQQTEVLSYPYDEQSQDVEDKYYCLRPRRFLTRVACRTIVVHLE